MGVQPNVLHPNRMGEKFQGTAVKTGEMAVRNLGFRTDIAESCP